MIRSIPAWLAIGMAALATLGPPPADRGDRMPVDVYVLAGQSNASGQGIVANLPSWVTPDPRAWLYHSPRLRSTSPPLTWAPLRPAGEEEGKFGPEIGFGNRMQQLARDRPVAIIKHAFTATDLDVAWNPGKEAEDRAGRGPQFDALVGVVDAGLKSMRDRGFEPTVRGMLWQQGESDADAQPSADRYVANLSRLIAHCRTLFRSPEMVFVYGFVLPSPNNQPYRDQVRAAQGAIDQDSGSPWAVPRAFVVYTDDLSHLAHDPHTPYPNDHVHIGTYGQHELGRRMAETMANKGKLAR